ncbi:hypothetical protein Bca4012_055253 [Brassica carinata]
MKQLSLISILCFVLISFDGAASFSEETCCNKGVFMPNGTYDANRRLILSYLPSNVTAQKGLFYNVSIGQEPNRIYAIGMCIPGSNPVECSDCIRTTSDALIRRCPNKKEAYSWQGGPALCHVHYSNTSFLGSLDPRPHSYVINGANSTSNLTEFKKIWEDLSVHMIDAASTAKSTPFSSDNYYTANTAALSPSQDIFAMMQCTPDLSSSDCRTCLRESVSHCNDPRCCNTRQGIHFSWPSCYFGMEMHSFSKASFVSFTGAFPPTPIDDPTSKINNEDSKGLSSGIVVAITVSTVVGVLILLVLGYVLYRRRKSYQRTLIETDFDISTRHSSQYDFKTIEAATNNFSRSNKLGEGGFGKVYKVRIFHVASVSAQTCPNNGGFTPNGTYDANRRLILSYLPSNVTAQEGLFFNSSIGQEPNRVYATGMCIPGSNPVECFDCIRITSDALIQKCPNQTEAYSWPTQCYVRYSNTSFFGSADLSPKDSVTNGANVDSNLAEFRKIMGDLVVHMVNAASTAKTTPSSSDNYYTANMAALNPSQDIFAMMQCTPDLSSDDCKTCLRHSTYEYSRPCCNTKQGTRIVRPSCYFRMEKYSFSADYFDIFTVASPPPLAVPQPAVSKGPSAGIVVAITVATVLGVLILLVLGYILCWRRKLYQRTQMETDSDISITHSSQYDFKTIEAATNNFSRSNKIGEGGFGEVYKGTLSNGTEVAVKRLSKMSGQGTREFRNEAVLVSKLQHRNLVRLLGFCLEGEEKILIYEFVPNKSLDYLLFNPEKQGQLDWNQRYKIIGGIARGILYLHQDSRLTIIHRDLKASNILLDADMNPKISDFGLCTIFGIDQTQGNTNRIAGTYAYMSPEYALQGQFSMKSDIYSFGVLVLEIISGKKNSNVYQMDETSTAGNLAWRLWRNGSPIELLDPAIGRNNQSNEVTRCIHIALLCVQDNPEDRPMLSTIILMLTSNTITLPMPNLPSFFPYSRPQFEQILQRRELSSQFLSLPVYLFPNVEICCPNIGLVCVQEIVMRRTNVIDAYVIDAY